MQTPRKHQKTPLNPKSQTPALPCREAEGVSEEELEAGLRQLGYQLQPDEMRILAKQMDPHAHSGAVSKSAFLASQIDWYDEDDDVRSVCHPAFHSIGQPGLSSQCSDA